MKHLHHPAVGDLELTYEGMELPSDPGLTLFTYTAEPGTPSEDGLKLLASWAATQELGTRPWRAVRPLARNTRPIAPTGGFEPLFRSVPTLVAREDRPQSPFQIDVCVVADVVGHLENPSAAKPEPRRVLRRYGVGAVTPDRHALTGQRVMAALSSEVRRRDGYIVDVERHRPEHLEPLANRALGEVDADNVFS